MKKPRKKIVRREPEPEFDPEFLAQMRQLVLKMNALEAQGAAFGLAPTMRELLRCPKCGLMENALCDGTLAVHYEDEPAKDTGLRFERLTNKKFLCPACYAQVEEPKWEPPPGFWDT